jgi:hypothetical protein
MNELRFLNQIAEALDRIADTRDEMVHINARSLEMQETHLKMMEAQEQRAREAHVFNGIGPVLALMAKAVGKPRIELMIEVCAVMETYLTETYPDQWASIQQAAEVE